MLGGVLHRRRLTVRAPRLEQAGVRDLRDALDLLPNALQVRRALRRYNRLPRHDPTMWALAWPTPIPVKTELQAWRARRLHRDRLITWTPRSPLWEP